MPDATQLLLFLGAGLLLNLTPGPDVLYIVRSALRFGKRAGVVAALGINAGCFVHIFAAALGVSALLAASATAFTALKWAGAAYLLWVGLRLLLARAPAPATDLQQLTHSGSAAGLWAVFSGGFLTNVLNPKVAIFFLAFVPQFIAPDTEHKALAFVVLGTLFNLNSVAVNAGWALAAAWMARQIDAAARRRAAPKAGEPPRGAATPTQWGSVEAAFFWLDKVAGAMFIAFGLRLVLSDNPSPQGG